MLSAVFATAITTDHLFIRTPISDSELGLQQVEGFQRTRIFRHPGATSPSIETTPQKK